MWKACKVSLDSACAFVCFLPSIVLLMTALVSASKEGERARAKLLIDGNEVEEDDIRASEMIGKRVVVREVYLKQ